MFGHQLPQDALLGKPRVVVHWAEDVAAKVVVNLQNPRFALNVGQLGSGSYRQHESLAAQVIQQPPRAGDHYLIGGSSARFHCSDALLGAAEESIEIAR